MPAAIRAFAIKDPKGTILCGTNTFIQDIEMGNVKNGDVILVTFKPRININPGQYILNVGAAAYEGGQYVVYDRRFDYMAIQIVANRLYVGLLDPQSVIEWTRL